MPTPDSNSVVAGGKPVSTGTRKVAPNIATTCWAPMPMVRGQLSRSSGATTSASDGTGFQVSGITVLEYTIAGHLESYPQSAIHPQIALHLVLSNTCSNSVDDVNADRPFLTADAAREQLSADLDAIDAALARIRETSTDLVGNAFRITVAERLENQDRTNRGLSYRMLGEIVDPPDGVEGPALPSGVRVRELLWKKLRITPAEVRRRVKLAARIRPRRSLTGPPLPPELPALADAVEAGDVGEDHVREVCKALDLLPNRVSVQD